MTVWPERIIDLSPMVKAGLMQRDPARYFKQCRAERLAEAKVQVDREMKRRYDGGTR